MPGKELLVRVREQVRIDSELCRALLGEFVGTTILLLVGNSVVAQNVLSRNAVNKMINVNVGFGLAIAFGVACCARLSGGHINPAVSLMFVSFGKLSIGRFFLYMIMQLLGAFAGATLTFCVYYSAIEAFDGGTRHVKGINATAGIFASYLPKHIGIFNGLIDQIIATAVFCFCIAHVTDRRNEYPPWAQPFMIGTSFVMIGTAFSLNCGYPVNPARDLGPRVFTSLAGYRLVFSYRRYMWFWVPIVGPFIGALIGGWLYQLTAGFQIPDGGEAPPPETPKTDAVSEGTGASGSVSSPHSHTEKESPAEEREMTPGQQVLEVQAPMVTAEEMVEMPEPNAGAPPATGTPERQQAVVPSAAPPEGAAKAGGTPSSAPSSAAAKADTPSSGGARTGTPSPAARTRTPSPAARTRTPSPAARTRTPSPAASRTRARTVSPSPARSRGRARERAPSLAPSRGGSRSAGAAKKSRPHAPFAAKKSATRASADRRDKRRAR